MKQPSGERYFALRKEDQNEPLKQTRASALKGCVGRFDA